jgi:hypothetical protein
MTWRAAWDSAALPSPIGELSLGIKGDNLLSFAQVAGVSAEWLMTGESNLAPKGEKASDQAYASALGV